MQQLGCALKVKVLRGLFEGVEVRWHGGLHGLAVDLQHFQRVGGVALDQAMELLPIWRITWICDLARFSVLARRICISSP